MTASALLLVSAFLHASWNALLKRERDPRSAVAGVLGVSLAVTATFALTTPSGSLPAAALAWTAGAGVFEGAYFVTLAAALAGAEYGAVYAVARGGAMVVVWPASRWWLHEPVTATGVAGAALVGAGTWLVATAGGRAWPTRRALAMALLCAGSIAGYHLCYDRALAAGGRAAPVFAVALAVAFPFVVMPARSRASRWAWPAGRELARWLLAGAVSAASFLLFLHGLAEAGAAVALTLRNTSIVFAQVLAVAIGERPTARQIAGSLVVALGATLTALP